ncbi:MAG: hypothetical protein V1820_01150 [archaeon]
MFSEIREKSLRRLILTSLGGLKGLPFSELFLISGAPPVELKNLLFRMELERLIEEPVANFYRVKKK